MLVPHATVDEHGDAPPGEDQVWPGACDATTQAVP